MPYHQNPRRTIFIPGTEKDTATWLTQRFEFPDWPTYSDFVYGGISQAWHDADGNPTPLFNRGQSVVGNNMVEVTIDYEVVDLEFRDPNIYDPNIYPGRSPICFIDEQSGQPKFVNSDRYVILQTYTFRALAPISAFEFYIFMHAHGADEYGAYVNSTYATLAPYDPLQYYTPYDPVHTTGNFCYDLTQWNGPAFERANHSDFVSVSCVREPNWFDNDTYRGGHWYAWQGGEYKPGIGSHWNVENRTLNGIDRIYMDEVGGAMGWIMNALDLNETTSITLAYMFGKAQEPTGILELTKEIVNPQSCYSPDDEVEFEITWTNTTDQLITDAVLVDYLPAGLFYPDGQYQIVFGDPNDPNDPPYTFLEPDPAYGPEPKNKYTWYIGDILPFSSDSRTISAFVTEAAEPGMPTINQATLSSSVGDVSDQCEVPICCWSSGIIYVNPDAVNGNNTGVSWQDGYLDLQRALARAAVGCGTEIWVKNGTYDPGRQADEIFVVPTGISVYGGFAGYETAIDQRNPNNRSTLTGAAETERNAIVVQMKDSTILDGFVVTGAANPEGPSYGVYGSEADFSLINCVVEKNDDFGIRAINGNMNLQYCHIRENKSDGVNHSATLGTDYELSISNSWIMRQQGFGVVSQNSTPRIFSSIISESNLSEEGNAAVRAVNPHSRPMLYNCTLAHNRKQAVSFVDSSTVSDPNDKDYPDVRNCILWLNNSGNEQFAGFTKEHIQYSCVYDPNDPDGENETVDSYHNFSASPEFLYIDPNNVRIRVGSRCVDAGNRQMDYSSMTDFSGRPRVMGEYADIGAYEVDPACQNDRSDFDTNHDGRVNYADDGFSLLAHSWLSRDPNDPSLPSDPNLIDPNEFIGWNPECDFNTDYAVDLADLLMFVEEAPWLWCACWLENGLPEMLSGGGMLLMAVSEMTVIPISPQAEEKSIEQQILDTQDVLLFLAKIWLEEPDLQQEIDAEAWQEFLNAVYQNLLDLTTNPEL